jgi:A/G-specific adenine glycosylase
MSKFADLVTTWYSRNARVLPWRNHADPYAIWVSEIMLQQTQVAAVLPYFERWMNRFPTLAKLARATEEEVLSLWEGLGYYARARNLLRAAKRIVDEKGGVLPSTAAELRSLPGVGRYTAAAIASMAFGADEATLDANIKRVLSRVFKISLPVNSTAGGKILWAIAAEQLPSGHAGEYNQGLMDIGATICLPRFPNCRKCPLKTVCKARKAGLQDRLPVSRRKVRIPTLVKSAVVAVKRNKVLLIKRQSRGLLGGMWEFPSVEVGADPEKDLRLKIHSQYKLKIRLGSKLLTVSHAYSHFKLTEHVFLCNLIKGSRPPPGFKWIAKSGLGQVPMGKVDRQIAKKLAQEENG